MDQQQLLYGYSSIAITLVLFILMIVLNETGFHIGRYVQNRSDDEIKSLTGSIQGSILGLLALLLGFTFSMSMQRYDSRSHALIAEANAIGTSMLRVELLPEQYREKTGLLFQEYVQARVEIGKLDLTKKAERKKYNKKISDLQGELWLIAVNATYDDPRPVTTGAFMTSLNEVIDAQGKRNALLQMHVPEVVLFLLFIVFVSSGGILGYSSGLSNKRVIAPTIMVSFLISMVVFIIIDLDRPKRGLITVDQGSMELLQVNFATDLTLPKELL